MLRLKRLNARLLRTLLQSVPGISLRELEMMARELQGKGWGSATLAEEVAAALSLLTPSSRREPVVLDIGANVGGYTAEFLEQAPRSTVFAFEPSATAFADLAERFAGDARVSLVRAAVAERSGTRTLFSDRPGSSLGSLTRRRLDHFGLSFQHEELIDVVCLDDWTLQTGIRPALVKLDIEGHELDALRGATNLIQAVEVVQFEFGGCNIDTRTYLQDFFYLFRENGFRLFRLGPNGLSPLDEYHEIDEAFTTTNFFAQRLN